MLCESCGQREAATTVKQSVGGQVKQKHLCASCANALFFSSMFHDMGFHHSFAKEGGEQSQKQCSHCHTTLGQINKIGKMGCADCYRTFGVQLQPSIRKIHGKSTHMGKIPQSAQGDIKRRSKLLEYKVELNRLIAAQEFEKAALLRDEIRTLEATLDE